MSQPMPEPTCWDCGATNDPGASECWLCQRRDWRATPGSPVPMKSEPSPTSGHASGLVALALGLVALGAVVIAPGLVLGLLIVVLPAWAVAEHIAHRRRNRGLPTSTTRKLVWIAVLSVVMPMLFVALFIALWMICMVTGPPTFH